MMFVYFFLSKKIDRLCRNTKSPTNQFSSVELQFNSVTVFHLQERQYFLPINKIKIKVRSPQSVKHLHSTLYIPVSKKDNKNSKFNVFDGSFETSKTC